jgi:hypothetical protein
MLALLWLAPRFASRFTRHVSTDSMAESSASECCAWTDSMAFESSERAARGRRRQAKACCGDWFVCLYTSSETSGDEEKRGAARLMPSRNRKASGTGASPTAQGQTRPNALPRGQDVMFFKNGRGGQDVKSLFSSKKKEPKKCYGTCHIKFYGTCMKY